MSWTRRPGLADVPSSACLAGAICRPLPPDPKHKLHMLVRFFATWPIPKRSVDNSDFQTGCILQQTSSLLYSISMTVKVHYNGALWQYALKNCCDSAARGHFGLSVAWLIGKGVNLANVNFKPWSWLSSQGFSLKVALLRWTGETRQWCHVY